VVSDEPQTFRAVGLIRLLFLPLIFPPTRIVVRNSER
jgi:hypothetical protein